MVSLATFILAGGSVVLENEVIALGYEELEVLLAGQRVMISDDRATLEDGTRAGSVLRMNE